MSPAAVEARTIEPTQFQARVLAFREHANILNAGGRGSGKSFSLLLDLLDHTQDPSARPLLLRESLGGLLELADRLFELAVLLHGARVVRNKQDGTISLPNGAAVQLACLADESTYAKLQGRSFTALYADEVGNYSAEGFRFFRRAMSGLRAAPGKRTRVHATANPHGRSHARILREFIRKAPPWTPFIDEHGECWLWTSSTLEDNPHIDRDAYRRKLAASTGGDTELARAWIDGDWNTLGGSMFAPPFDQRVHIRPEIPPIVTGRYTFRLACDWGTASPSVALLVGRLREPVAFFRQGDLVVLDETDTAVGDDDLTAGTGMGPAAWAEEIKELVRRNSLQHVPHTISDDARGLGSETVCEELRRCGVPAVRPYRKDRVGTWALLRGLLASAVARDGRPALWISSRCTHLLRTLPDAPRNIHRPEDTDPRWNEDHWLDALGYAVQELHGTPTSTVGRTTGHY
jgi:hypothetical protein